MANQFSPAASVLADIDQGAMQRAADLLEHIKDGFLELDGTLHCVTANRAAAEMLCLEHAELVGADSRKIMSLAGNENFAVACERSIREQIPVQQEAIHFPRQDRWIELEYYPTDLGVSLFLRDVSERRAADEFRELMTGIIGHDLRTPLGAITGTAAILLSRGGLEPAVEHAVRRIANSGARMSEMVTKLLDFTRVRFGKGLPIERSCVDIARVCLDVANELAAAHPHRQVSCDLAGELKGEWDAARLSQALSNLVENAMQHGDPRSPVRLSARPIGEAHVRIAVHNEGAPIAADVLPVIFQPFRQANGIDAKAPGLGLGLFIAQSIVRAHGGTIEVTSTQESGTTFAALLPCSSGMAREAAVQVIGVAGCGDPETFATPVKQ